MARSIRGTDLRRDGARTGRLRWLVTALGACAALVGAEQSAIAQTPQRPTGTVVVLNKGSASADFIDVASGRIVATAPTGEGPHELVVSPDGRTAVGTDYGGGGAGGSSLSVFDIATGRRVRTIELGRFTRPHGIAYLPEGDRVAVTSETTGTVVVVEVESGEVAEVLSTGANGSHMLGLTADGLTIWTGDIGSNTVTELNRSSGGKVRSFPAPAQPEAVNVSPDGSRVFAGSNATGRVTAWDTRTGEATTVAEGFGWPYRIFLTPGVEQIIVPDLRGEVLRFFDGDGYDEVGSISFRGDGPQGLILHPDGRHLFLALSASDRIAIVDIQRRTVAGYLPVSGSGPDGIGFSPVPVG